MTENSKTVLSAFFASKNGKESLSTKIISSVSPELSIVKVTEVELEYLHTNVENYLNYP